MLWIRSNFEKLFAPVISCCLMLKDNMNLLYILSEYELFLILYSGLLLKQNTEFLQFLDALVISCNAKLPRTDSW